MARSKRESRGSSGTEGPKNLTEKRRWHILFEECWLASGSTMEVSTHVRVDFRDHSPIEGRSKMRRSLITTSLLLTAALLFIPAGAGVAAGGGGSHSGEHRGTQARTAWHGGSHGSGFAPHRSFSHDHFRGHSHFGARVFIGSGFLLGAPWWWGPGYPYYAEPPVVIQEEPPAYIQQGAEPPPPAYWYYCQSPQGYYPYVKDCPGGWLTVVPPSNPPPPAP